MIKEDQYGEQSPDQYLHEQQGWDLDKPIILQELLNHQYGKQYEDSQWLKKQNINTILMGHVDAGKSQLVRHILAHNEWKNLNIFVNDNWRELSEWTRLNLPPLRKRKPNMFREYFKQTISIKQRKVTFMDFINFQPGVVGNYRADVGILIVSAKHGQFQNGFEFNGSTKQQSIRCLQMGLSQMIVVINKMDTVKWSELRYDDICFKMRLFLQNCGYTSISYLPVDSLRGVNIWEAADIPWYKENHFLNVLEELKIQQKYSGAIRLPITDVTIERGSIFCYGRVLSGIILQGQKVKIMPGPRRIIINEILSTRDIKMPFARAGENVKLRMSTFEGEKIDKGDVICGNENLCEYSDLLKVQIHFQDEKKKRLFSKGYQCSLGIQWIWKEVEIQSLKGKINKNGKLQKAQFLVSGESGLMILQVLMMLCRLKGVFAFRSKVDMKQVYGKDIRRLHLMRIERGLAGERQNPLNQFQKSKFTDNLQLISDRKDDIFNQTSLEFQ